MSVHPYPRGILLDLDDTLYPERQYFLSGLRAVSVWLSELASGRDYWSLLTDIVARHGRKGILDRIAPPMGMQTAGLDAWRESLLLVYRNHFPNIILFDDAPVFVSECRARGIRLGLVTDGKSCVQWRKIWALGLDALLDVIVVTEDIDAPKPSPRAFRVAAQRLGLRTHECVYVADDESKDFIGPHQLGMTTLLLRRELEWPIASPAPSQEAEAQYQANSFIDAPKLLFGEAG